MNTLYAPAAVNDIDRRVRRLLHESVHGDYVTISKKKPTR